MWRYPSTASFLEGLWPFRPRKFEAITVSASHQLALTTSLPFVHTARRSYRLNGPVKCSDRGDVGVRRPRRREKSIEPYHLEEGEVVTRFP
ncbi:hypothetical protein ACHQM5_030974 [Ranunculus cassubicifolius]